MQISLFETQKKDREVLVFVALILFKDDLSENLSKL